MTPLLGALFNRTSLVGIVGSIGSLTLAHWSSIAAIACSLGTLGYVLYRWQRDARERTCDVAHCPLRHRPD